MININRTGSVYDRDQGGEYLVRPDLQSPGQLPPAVTLRGSRELDISLGRRIHVGALKREGGKIVTSQWELKSIDIQHISSNHDTLGELPLYSLIKHPELVNSVLPDQSLPGIDGYVLFEDIRFLLEHVPVLSISRNLTQALMQVSLLGYTPKGTGNDIWV